MIFFLAYFTKLGSEAPEGLGAGAEIELTNLTPDAQAGLQLFLANGCSSCHMIKNVGAPGPGPNLTNVGGRGPDFYLNVIQNGRGIMPAFEGFTDEEYRQLAAFLDGLGTEFR